MGIEVKSLTTKFGTAHIHQGYWTIRTRKEGNRDKRLHRLIYEDYHNCTLLPHAIIHHKDGNKLNNCIDNLEVLTKEEHQKIHAIGKVTPYETQLKQSISQNNSSGYFRVSKKKCGTCTYGFIYQYRYYDETGKRHVIASVDLDKLKEKVLKEDLPWGVL